jgi:adenine-specific DNA-methyltransferase
VLVTPDRIVVLRWDDIAERPFTRASVEQRIADFYHFLVLDRVTDGRRVVEHAVSLFRRMRALIVDADKEGKSVEAFLLLLAAMIEELPLESSALQDLATRYSLSEQAAVALLSAPLNALEALIQEYRAIQVGITELKLHPDLAIRHAGGVIFQEAHFELLRTPTPDLFGYIPKPPVRPQSRGGVHFTPPALARSIVEQTLAAVGDVRRRSSLVLTDPACGSGAFLIEAIRALRRAGSHGSLRVCGRDTSEHAVAMARFAVSRALADWRLAERPAIDLQAMDALRLGAIPNSDIIVMNPPFGSWANLEPNQREQVREVLGPTLHGRADLSMAFILHALQSVRGGGALGALFPASLLALQAARGWRLALADQANVRFLASLGDYGLFEYALVQVGAIVLGKNGSEDEITTLWTRDDRATTGDALRALRRKLRGGPSIAANKDLRIASVPAASVRDASTWRIGSVLNERLFSEIGKVVRTQVRDLFAVQQGIRTGANNVFLLSADEWKKLPKNERDWFRPAIMNASIQSGRIYENFYVFYPYTNNELAFLTEESLLRALPRYGREQLLPNKDRLRARAPSENSRRWWELTRKRSWLSENNPRIISKYFGERGGFAFDAEGRFAVVQGFGWTPSTLLTSIERNPNRRFKNGSYAWLAAYTALFNSRIFEVMLAAVAPQVAGGQYDLSPRYVDTIPLPNLQDDALHPTFGAFVRRLDALGEEIRLDDADWIKSVEELVALLYRTRLTAWVES